MDVRRKDVSSQVGMYLPRRCGGKQDAGGGRQYLVRDSGAGT